MLVIALLFCGITAIGKMAVVLCVGMLVTVLWVIVSGFLNFNSKLAFDFPPGASTFSERLPGRLWLCHADRDVQICWVITTSAIMSAAKSLKIRRR